MVPVTIHHIIIYYYRLVPRYGTMWYHALCDVFYVNLTGHKNKEVSTNMITHIRV